MDTAARCVNWDEDAVPAKDVTDPTPAVIAAVEQRMGAACAACARGVCGHEVVMSFVLGFKDAPRCLGCLAAGLGRELAALRASMREHIDRRDCWRAGWRRASELERAPDGAARPCAAAAATHAAIAAPGVEPASSSLPHAAEWDAGDLGCGDLVLELRVRMQALAPGQTLLLTARDPGAPADLPAWCGLTGHKLRSARHPVYVIERRDG